MSGKNTPDAVVPPGADPPTFDKTPPTTNAATAASAASVRALTSQAIAFYFRAPVKAFFRTRVDYLAYARALQEQELAERRRRRRGSIGGKTVPSSSPSSTVSSVSSSQTSWLRWIRARLRATTPGVLASAVRHYGWRVVPDQVLPPLIANVGVGALLYTTYLHVLGYLHPESAIPSRRVYPPPGPGDTFAAGLVAGAIQSVVAAPLDAVQARWDVGRSAAGMTGSGNPTIGRKAPGLVGRDGQKPKSMWEFSAAKLKEIGLRGIFAGWALSFVKDSLGSAVFFSVFEYVKAQGYYNFVRWYYGSLNEDAIIMLVKKRPTPPGIIGPLEDGSSSSSSGAEDDDLPRMPRVIRPHYAIEPAFLLLAGMSASVAQQIVLHPLSHVQAEHWERLETLDQQVRRFRKRRPSYSGGTSSSSKSSPWAPWNWRKTLKANRDAYKVTWDRCVAEAKATGLGMRRWLYRGFWWNTIRQVPSTSAGLIIFELFRRKYGLTDQVRINRDGYDILLN
ncbi:uncharacterized protein CTHT_0049130 [Thermochaetoides thermophila DSM 1495]|uniref:Mitochondrial carrier protein n=1 Tax=Chaetomium thermophilum (strain DSM 1495 / CBS 144.50 / IMI 039719) TaxID=759272 RepID=G0SB72_CHATD|nr:hypothetical protein CTHT_0049130 [Thermochaetoides thermophila DSM 1495]EGS19452.1 hypothetical protein CTHT_0049130 [Thermochaetoides thermophila DSM 1495]